MIYRLFLLCILICTPLFSEALTQEKSEEVVEFKPTLSLYEQALASIILLEQYDEIDMNERAKLYERTLTEAGISHESFFRYLDELKADMEKWYKTLEKVNSALEKKK